jgi:hypothetical protein
MKTCGPSRIITSMGLKMTAGNKQVLFFHFFCRSTFSDDPAASGTMEIGAKSTVFADINQDCGPDEVAVGIQGRSGVHVNAAGLMCGPKPVPTALYDAFKIWISANHFGNATISINGSLNAGFGSRRSTAMVPVASLSKAITAMCIAQLVDAGRMSYTDTIATRLPQYLAANKPADASAAQITIAQLLRHTSGIKADTVGSLISGQIKNDASADEAMVKAALASNLGPQGKSEYNNVDYAILGMMIKADQNRNFKADQNSYELYCKLALFPSKFDFAHIGNGTKGLGAFGGWETTTQAYANFISNHFRKLSPKAEQFMVDSYGVGYGLGVGVKKTSRGRNIVHTGNWPSFAGWTGSPTTTPTDFSSYFALWDTGTLVVVTMDKHFTKQDQIDSLDMALRRAAGIP